MTTRFDDLVVTHWGARFMGRNLPCAIGRGGIGQKGGEGDGITPVGTFSLMGGGYRPDRITLFENPLGLHPIGLRDIWSDDPRDPDYNHGLRVQQHPYSHERLRRADPLYDLFAIVDFNYPKAQAGKGSAIFLHTWRKPRHPTEGCVAFAADDLVWLLSNWSPKSQVVIKP